MDSRVSNKKPEKTTQDLERVLNQVFAGMPCSNRVSAAEKAAFDRYLAKGRAALAGC